MVDFLAGKEIFIFNKKAAKEFCFFKHLLTFSAKVLKKDLTKPKK
jgi:hypothetical protein